MRFQTESLYNFKFRQILKLIRKKPKEMGMINHLKMPRKKILPSKKKIWRKRNRAVRRKMNKMKIIPKMQAQKRFHQVSRLVV